MSETASEYLNHLSDEEKSKIHQDDDINNFKKLVMNSIKPDSSPLPWKYNKTPNHEDMVWYYEIEDSNGRYLAAVADEEKAIKIVHYANSHAALVEALEKAVSTLMSAAISLQLDRLVNASYKQVGL